MLTPRVCAGVCALVCAVIPCRSADPATLGRLSAAAHPAAAPRTSPAPPQASAPPAPIAPTSSGQAVALAQQTLRALAGVTVISDATIQASANYVAGSDQQAGTATLVAHNGYESNITLSLGDGQRTEIRNGFVQPPQGKRAGTDGVWQIMALHNCWTDPAWFFPALTLQSALNDPQVYFTYLGPAVRAGIAVIGIQISRFVPGQSANSTALIQTLAQIQIYVSPTNYVPVAMDFNLHPDSDAGVNLPVEIQYSGWHALGPVQVPSQMQKFLQGCLTLTLGGITAAVNTGVPQSAFAM